MESQEEFIGGVGIMFIVTLLFSVFASKKKIGMIGAWAIGAGIGLIFSFILSSIMGALIGIVSSVIATIASPSSKIGSKEGGIANELESWQNSERQDS